MKDTDVSRIARELGRRGGVSRSRRLSRQRRAEIALMGAKARAESLRLAGTIRHNFDYLRAVDLLHPPPRVLSESTCNRTLPGIYAHEEED